MRGASAFALISAALAGQAAGHPGHGDDHDAVVVKNNPIGVVYKATLPDKPFFAAAAIDGNVKGYISATAAKDGEGVKYNVKFENLPKEGGPFMYHIHVDPVPQDGNCTKTLAHLDPFVRGEETPCDAADPASCQVGDLSGKYGEIKSDPFEATYTDLYSSTREGPGAFFGNRSFVLHYANKTRITCANFKIVSNTTWTYPVPTPPATEKPAAPTDQASTTGAGAETTPSASTVPSGASAMAVSGVCMLVTMVGLMALF